MRTACSATSRGRAFGDALRRPGRHRSELPGPSTTVTGELNSTASACPDRHAVGRRYFCSAFIFTVRRLTPGATGTFVALLAAWGDDDDAGSSTGSTGSTATATDTTASGAASGGGTVEVTDVLGTPQIPAPPQRVVCLDGRADLELAAICGFPVVGYVYEQAAGG